MLAIEKYEKEKKLFSAFATLLQNSVYICVIIELKNHNMTSRNLSLAMLLIFSMVFIACDKDDPEIPNEEELITTVRYTLTSVTGGSDVVLTFVDLDGDDGNEPVITGGTLEANTIYSGRLELLNEAESPAEDITEEISEEDEEHQFFFSTTVTGLSVTYGDQDENAQPVGLATSVTTGAAGSGTLTVILRHEPMKSAAGVAEGDITNAGGETDIQVTFPIDVQ